MKFLIYAYMVSVAISLLYLIVGTVDGIINQDEKFDIIGFMVGLFVTTCPVCNLLLVYYTETLEVSLITKLIDYINNGVTKGILSLHKLWKWSDR